MSSAPGKPVSFSRPKVGYFSNRPRILKVATSYVMLLHLYIGQDGHILYINYQRIGILII